MRKPILKLHKYIVEIWSKQKLCHYFKQLVECEKSHPLYMIVRALSFDSSRIAGGIYSRNVNGNYSNSSLNSSVVNNS